MPFGILFLDLTHIHTPSFFVFLIFITFQSVCPPVALAPPSFLYVHALSRHHHTTPPLSLQVQSDEKTISIVKIYLTFPSTEDSCLNAVLLV